MCVQAHINVLLQFGYLTPCAVDACLQTVQAVCSTNSVTNHCFGKAFYTYVQHQYHTCLIQVAHLRDKCRGLLVTQAMQHPWLMAN